MALLEVDNLCVDFGGVIAADHVSFSVNTGEIIGLIGPNGAGKTTTLNLISGIYKSDSGRVLLEGRDISGCPGHQRAKLGIARTFQTPHMLMDASISDNLMLGADLNYGIGFAGSFLGKKGHGFREETEELLKIADLPIDWDADVASLPYGQLKRLEIIRSILTHPKVILVDEPAAGLNGKELEQSVKLIKYAKEQGIGIVLIEHNMGMVMSVCERIVVLDFGKVIAIGTPEEVSGDKRVIEAYLGRN